MHSYVNSFEWLKSGLFWRTFFFLTILVMTSMLAWYGSYQIIEQDPKTQQKAAQLSTIVLISKTALLHTPIELRSTFFSELASNQSIQIITGGPIDKIETNFDNTELLQMQALIKSKLGNETRFANKINGIEGLWVSFSVYNDKFWLRVDNEEIQKLGTSFQLIGWLAASLFITIFGAVFVSKLINEPLSYLSNAARLVAKGKKPNPLEEKGPSEIRETNASFNQMVDDLAQIESDRAVILAGISHDLRTPLSRMLLEVEMAQFSDETRKDMQSDLAQMDAIINQFLDYAKPIEEISFEAINLSELLTEMILEVSKETDIVIRSNIDKNVIIQGTKIELFRLFKNLFENAKRYGRSPTTNKLQLDIQCNIKNKFGKQDVLISFRDHGNGVPLDQITRILRPFTQLDVSRSQGNGSGLGLAIVDRIIKCHGGRLRTSNHSKGGFQVVIAL